MLVRLSLLTVNIFLGIFSNTNRWENTFTPRVQKHDKNIGADENSKGHRVDMTQFHMEDRKQKASSIKIYSPRQPGAGDLCTAGLRP